MGDAWDALTEAEKRRSGEEILRAKMPPGKGLSARTAAAVASGALEIDSDDPNAQLLQGILYPEGQ